jgi:heptose-I-phosphate ethanolaminephosphotransferase
LQDPSIFKLARSAGYKLFWLSNQDDRFINAAFASDADRFKLASRTGARNAATLDGVLVSDVVDALNDPAPLKLIVVHLIGQHQFYDLRYPAEKAVFGARPDSVVEALKSDWRFPWVIAARNQYDNAILYFDAVMRDVVAALDASQARREGASELLFISDHAQEVGHLSNNFGHAPQLESGFAIPMLRYASGASPHERCGPPGPDVEKRPFQSHRLYDTLLARLGVVVDAPAPFAARPENDLFGPDFVERPILRRWEPSVSRSPKD